MDISMEKVVIEDHKTIEDVFEEKKISCLLYTSRKNFINASLVRMKV